MNTWTWVANYLVTALVAFLAFQLGRRWEAGRKELRREELEATRERRSGRPGTVKLKKINIRR